MQIIANAGRCVLYEDRANRIHMKSSFVPDMTATSDDKTRFSKMDNLLKNTKKDAYSMASVDFSKVDGSVFFLPKNGNYLNTGYVSESVSNKDGEFAKNPKITINLESEFDAFGVLINFRNTAPSDFCIRTYNEDVIMDESVMAVKTVQAIINGEVTNLTLNTETGLWEADLTAPEETSWNNNAEHYFSIALNAIDSAGNQTIVDDRDLKLGDKLKLRVLETTLPVIIITSPTEDEITGNSMPIINFTVTDSGSGVNPDTIGITIDGGDKILSGITKAQITNGYMCSYAVSESLSDGMHTIYADADDFDGNSAVQRTVNFKVDITPPELSVASPVNNYVTNNPSVTISGTASDVTSGLESVTVKMNGNNLVEVDVGADGSFVYSESLTEGANTIVITATDMGGMQSSITRVATLDLDAPQIGDVTITPNPVSTGGILNIKVSVSD